MHARLFAVVLALAGIWCLSQQSMAQFSSRTCHIGDAGFCAPAVAVSGMPPTLDHIGKTTAAVYTNPNSFSLQTVAGETCIVIIAANGKVATTDTTGVTDSASNTYTFRVNSQNLSNAGANGMTLSEFSMHAGTTATVTASAAITPGAGVTYLEAFAWCLSGVNATPFDPNGSVPSVGTSGGVTLATTHPTTFVTNSQRDNPVACPSGWVPLQNVDFAQACYKLFTSPQASITCADLNSNNGLICDAVAGP
jgi:hypothetical protein